MKDNPKQTFPGQTDPADDAVNHPAHYTEHPSGVECIEITEHMGFCLGNAFKYVFRAGLKDATVAGEIEDLKKAVWYLNRELERLSKSEVWAAFPVDPRYQVSTRGRVRGPKGMRKAVVIPNGYATIKTTKQIFYVHRMVLQTFIGPGGDLVAAHNNGCKTNNHLENLRWDTVKGNLRDRIRHGTVNSGDKNGQAKLSPVQVEEIRRLEGGLSEVQCADKFGVSRSTIGRIWRMESWREYVAPIDRVLCEEGSVLLELIWEAALTQSDEDLTVAIKHIEQKIHKHEAQIPNTVRVSGVPYSVDQEALEKMMAADDGD